MIKCNSCWRSFASQDRAGDDCANKQFSKERICPSCDKSLSQRGGISRNILASTQDKIVPLCGLNPKDTLEFWNYQVQVTFDYEKADLGQAQTKISQLEKVYGEKLEECHSKTNSLKRQLEAMAREIELDKQQIAELEEKYSEKSRQKRKLEELYDSLKSKYESGGNPTGAVDSYHRTIGAGYNSDRGALSKPKQVFSRLSPSGLRSGSPHPTKLSEASFVFRKSPGKVFDKPLSSPSVTPGVSNHPNPFGNSPKRSLFRTVKIPESPKFSRFGKQGLT